MAVAIPVPPARLPNRERHHTVAQHQHRTSTQRAYHLCSRGVRQPAGRMRGLRNKLTEEVICALLRDFRQHGQKAVCAVRQTDSAGWRSSQSDRRDDRTHNSTGYRSPRCSEPPKRKAEPADDGGRYCDRAAGA